MYSIFKTVKKLSNFTTRWRPKNQDNTIAPSSSNAISTIPVDNELDCILRRIASPIPFINFVNEIRLCWLNVWGRERMTLRNSQKLRQASQRRWAKLSENKKEKYKLLAANWSSTRLPLSLLTKTRSELGQYEATRSSHSLPSSPSSSSLAFVPEFNRSSPTRRRQSPTMTTRQATRRTLRRVVQSPRSQRVATASRTPRSARGPRSAGVPRLPRNKRILVDQRASTLILQRSTEAERDRAEAEIEAMSRALVAPPLIMSLPTTPVQPAVENSVPRTRASKRMRLVQPVNPRMPVPIPSMEVVELKKPRTLRKAKNVESNAFTMPENIETKSVDPKDLEFPETIEVIALPKKSRASRKKTEFTENFQIIESAPRDLEFPETSMAPTRKLRGRPKKVESTAPELPETFQSMAPSKKPRVSRKSKNVESIEVRTPEDIEMIESPPRTLELPETSMASTRKLRKRPMKVKSTALELSENFQSMAPLKKPRVSRNSKNVESIEVRTPEDIEMIDSPPRALELPETSMAPTRKLRKRPKKVKSTALELPETFQSMAPQKKPRVSRKSKNVETNAAKSLDPKSKSMELTALRKPRRSRSLEVKRNRTVPKKRKQSLDVIEVDSSREIFHSLSSHLDRFNGLPKRSTGSLFAIVSSEHVTVKRR